MSILPCVSLRSADLTPPLAPVRDSSFYVEGRALLCPFDLEKWLGQQHHFSGPGAKEGWVLVWGTFASLGPLQGKETEAQTLYLLSSLDCLFLLFFFNIF